MIMQKLYQQDALFVHDLTALRSGGTMQRPVLEAFTSPLQVIVAGIPTVERAVINRKDDDTT